MLKKSSPEYTRVDDVPGLIESIIYEKYALVYIYFLFCYFRSDFEPGAFVRPHLLGGPEGQQLGDVDRHHHQVHARRHQLLHLQPRRIRRISRHFLHTFSILCGTCATVEFTGIYV